MKQFLAIALMAVATYMTQITLAEEDTGRSPADRADHSLNLALDSMPDGDGPRVLRFGGGTFEGVDTVAAQVATKVTDDAEIQVYGFANNLDESGVGVGVAISF